ncbi:MAG TPA: ATP-binding cassette domain-containing protein, partial [Candidatus Eremiobacteraeota bacterium]|nr:ATP-binding cassette domain-containing protein [Candidatus Eremiobacteraeota bacterium]
MSHIETKLPEAPPVKLEVRDLCRNFITYSGETVVAMKGLNLDMYDGEFLVVLGPSGCGKSTFLRIVAGLDNPTSGSIKLDGRPISEPGPDRGMVFQKYTSFPWLTVGQNVSLPLHIQGRLMPYLVSRNRIFYLLFCTFIPGFKERQLYIQQKVK